eukprot:CCRYP_014343-RA/>CCRYP_014343-RA protein AED:0.26 eAED:0.26 QI:126/0.5/0.66/1/1/1/3/176/970
MTTMRCSPPFERLAFERKVNDALRSAERILDIERHPRLAGDVEHTYGSKYELVNATTNAALIAYMNVFEKMGLDSSVLRSIDKTKPTTLRFDANTTSKFVKEVIVDVPMERSVEEEQKTRSTGVFGHSESKRVSKVVHHVTEFHFNLETSWSLSVYSGTSVQDKKVIESRKSSTVLITQSKDNALPEHNNFPPQDLTLTWLLQQINTDRLTSQFKVDTEDDDTKTPRRNKATEKAIEFSRHLSQWSNAIKSIFVHGIVENLLKKHNPALPNPGDLSLDRLNTIHEEYSIFNPILPVMEERITSEETLSENINESIENQSNSIIALEFRSNENREDVETVLSTSDLSKLINEHVRTLEEAITGIAKSCPDEKHCISFSELGLLLLSHHIGTELCTNYIESMTYVESMIETQLVSAIGKRLTPDDLETFMRFHNARLLSPEPKPFSHAIRQPEHYPVGLLSIESVNNDDKDNCIYSHSRIVNAGASFHIPLNAATSLELGGNQVLHGWLQYRFGSSHKMHQLVARARQFSSFILVIGTMTGPSTLEPKDADEVFIPLLVSELPTAKEFKDAVKSLSPEQQRFARSYRSMQLASSVFGMCVIQIKPQLESLLRLPPGALDKEMRLTQDLMELFVEYQVPSDLLSYNGVTENVANADKVHNVRQNVQAVIDVINSEKEKQLKAAKLKTEMAAEDAFQRAFQDDEEGGSSSFSRQALFSGKGAPASVSNRHNERALACAGMNMVGRSMAKAMAAPPPSPQMAMMMELPAYQMESAEGEPIFRYAKAETSIADITTITSTSKTTEKYTTTNQQAGSSLLQSSVDFTLVPKILDAAVERIAKYTSLRSTVLKTSDSWVRNRQENLLTALKKQTLNPEDVKKEKNKAFDLLDALSRSGSLPIKYSELHVMIAATHCFEKDVIDTIVCDNVNPIEKIELSTILFASTVHGVAARELIKNTDELHRLEGSTPLLLQQEGH